MLGAHTSEFSSLFSEIDLLISSSLDEHSHEASDGVGISLGDQKVLDGFSGVLGVLIIPVGLEVAIEVLSGCVPGGPSELPGLDESVSVGASGSVVDLGVEDQPADVVNMEGVGLHLLQVLVEVSTEVSAAGFHGLQDGDGLTEVVFELLSNLGVLVLVESESEPLIGVLSSGVQVLADVSESDSVLLEGVAHSSGLLMLSSGSVEIEGVEVGLLAPEPVSGYGNDDLVVPGVVEEVVVVDVNLGNSVGDASEVDDFGVDGGGEAGGVPVLGEGLVAFVEDDWSDVDEAFGEDGLDDVEGLLGLDGSGGVLLHGVVGGGVVRRAFGAEEDFLGVAVIN